jgi:hypothetical protein
LSLLEATEATSAASPIAAHNHLPIVEGLLRALHENAFKTSGSDLISAT